jgi:uncharacterized delta-60 repeat protein
MQNSPKLSAALVLSLFFSLSLTIFAQIDPTFAPAPSKNTVADPTAKGQIAQPDGKVVIWGGAVAASGLAKGQIARLNADGSVDTSFNYCGCYFSNILAVTLQPDGKIVVSGSDTNGVAAALRINSDGSLDPGFVLNVPLAGFSTIQVWAILPDGKILAERHQSQIGASTGHIIRMNSNGSNDSSFTPILIFTTSHAQVFGVTDLLAEPDGKITFTLTPGGSSTDGFMERHNADGTLDATWSAPNFEGEQFGRVTLAGIDRLSDGSYIVGGIWGTVNGFSKKNFIHVFSAGNLDLNFTAPANFLAGGIPRVLSSGKILVTAVNDVSNAMKFHRLNADGSEDMSLSEAKVEAMGDIAAEIDREKVNFDKSVKSDFMSGGSTITAVQNRYVLDAAEKVLFFGTSTTAAQQFFRLNTDGTKDDSFVPDVKEFASVKVVARQNDGKVIIAGDFLQVSGVSRKGIARLNFDGSVDTGFDPGTGFNSTPLNLVIQPDGKILAVGEFATYNGTPRAGIARLNSDGTLDTGFAPVIGGANTVALQADGKILIGGSFSTVNGTSQPRLARLNSNGTLDAAFNPIIGSGSVNKIILENAGQLTIVGTFTGVNGFNRNTMVRLNSDGTLDQSFTLSGGASSAWRAPDGKYLVSINASGGGEATLMRKNANGSDDATFTIVHFKHRDSSLIIRVNSILFQANGKMIVGGQFDTVNSAIGWYMVRLGSNGALDNTFQPYPDKEVSAMIVQSNGKLIAVGSFSTILGTVRAGVARLSTGEAFQAARSTLWDFDGDGKSDVSVYRPSDGNWFLTQSQAGFFVQQLGGQVGDIMAPADFDGDGRTDFAIYRSGQWSVISSGSGTLSQLNWGAGGDIPVPGDYDGDGRADFIYYHPATQQWFRKSSLSGATSIVQWGIAGDIPLNGDFDGDGKVDPVIYRPSDGGWWYLGSTSGVAAWIWGIPGDIPAAADYDGDGRTDIAIFRPSDGGWYVINSHDFSVSVTGWGGVGDRPVAADYDGDGKADVAIYRPSTGNWFISRSTAGFALYQFGAANDVPVPTAYVP